MINDDDWLDFHYAANEIKAKLGVSLGKAQAMLRQVCATGEVRSQKQPYITVGHEAEGQGPPERIEPSEWREHEIDLMTTYDGCWYMVNVSKSDFGYWLDQHKPKPEQGRQPLVIKYLTKRFSGRRVPDPAHCVRKDLLAELRKVDPILAQLDIKTLMRAINKYNSSLAADGKR